MQVVRYVMVVAAGYLLGSFPTGYLAARLFKGVDPRRHGSGRTGGTNILRTAGKGAALLTITGDLLKGFLAVWVARSWLGTQTSMVLTGLAAVVGHNRSIFLRFRGGAGSMTNAGAMLGLAPHVVPFMAVAAVISARVTRMGSVTSIAAAATMVIGLVVSYFLSLTPLSYVLYGVLACALILLELKPNLQRLSKGTERRVEDY